MDSLTSDWSFQIAFDRHFTWSELLWSCCIFSYHIFLLASGLLFDDVLRELNSFFLQRYREESPGDPTDKEQFYIQAFLRPHPNLINWPHRHKQNHLLILTDKSTSYLTSLAGSTTAIPHRFTGNSHDWTQGYTRGRTGLCMGVGVPSGSWDASAEESSSDLHVQIAVMLVTLPLSKPFLSHMVVIDLTPGRGEEIPTPPHTLLCFIGDDSDERWLMVFLSSSRVNFLSSGAALIMESVGDS